MTEDLFEQGMETRRLVLGDAHVDRAEATRATSTRRSSN